ncbi:SulP family inorganic anion transporter [Nocardioides sp.]|uniref:SulP family inorganic anion transporter n=1 Tax=Nocardioides sp. TaxID=35761 RepID=UPI003563E9B1
MDARRHLPAWTVGYQRSWLRGDLLAGVTVTAYLIPQVMAYAALAGVPAVVGLWAAVGALSAYLLLGSSPLLSVGPESTTALMTAAALGSVAGATRQPTEFAAALALVVALFCLLGWFGHLAALAQLLSRPVLVGYMAGIAVIMVLSQSGRLTGIASEADGVVAETADVLTRLDQAHLPTLALGLGTLVAMLLGSAFWPRAPVALLGMLGATAAVALLDLRARGVTVVGEIPAGLPVPGLPALSASEVLPLLAPALGVAFVGYTDNVLTGRAFAARAGHRVDDKRELLALGAANLGAGLLHGFPVSSSGSRTAIAHAVGARTQLAGGFTVLFTVVAILTARPLLSAFPTAALGAVVVYAAVKLVELSELRRFAAFRRSELVLALGTTLAVLVVGVLVGVLVAIGLSILDLLRRVAHPHDAVQGNVPGMAGMHDVADFADAAVVPGLMIYRYDSPLFFANAEDFRERALASVAASSTPVEWFVLNTEAMVTVDITALDALESLRAELTGRGIVFGLARVKQDLLAELRPSGLVERIGPDRIFPSLRTAVQAFRDARPG